MALLNARAGAIQRNPNGNISEAVVAAFERRGIAAEAKLLHGSDLSAAAEAAVQQARAGKIDAIVVGGGDGTIGTVAAAAVDTKIPLGVLPLGTLNHFARDLGIPLDLEGAVAVIAAATCRAVDVADVNGRIFLNNSSIGVYPYMVLERDKRRRHDGLGKWPAMIWAALKVLWLFPLRRFRVRAARRAESCKTPCLFVGNNQYRLDLLGLGRRERLDGGELWLYIARQQTRLSLIWFTFRALMGLTNPKRDLICFSALNAEIGSRRKSLSVATDGEVNWMHPPLKYRSRPAALYVFTPAGQQVQDA